MNEIKIFDNPEFGEIRTMCDDNNEPHFCAADLCTALGYANQRKPISDHVDEDDVTKRYVIDKLGRPQSMNFVNESGMYALIFGSKLDKAKAFKRWVTSEVLPAIRKTGAYAAPAATAAEAAQPAAHKRLGYADTRARVYLIEALTRRLGLTEAARLEMYGKLADEHGIEIPGYTPAAAPGLPTGHETGTLAALLAANGSIMRPQRFCRMLVRHGYLEMRTNFDDGNQTVGYYAVSEKGLEFGRNEPNPKIHGETVPKWYADRFGELYDLVTEGEY